jgi:glycerophosphoryl diester phosphodiesterase
VPSALEKIQKLSGNQKLLASLNQRSADSLGGLVAALDRLNAIEGCVIAVEKGLLATEMDICLQKVGTARLGAWVPNHPEDVAYWLAQPIHQITTDRPDVALALRKA